MNVYEGNDLRDAVLYWEARGSGEPPDRAPNGGRSGALEIAEWLRCTASRPHAPKLGG